MKLIPTFIKKVNELRSLFVVYRKPEYLRVIKKWLDIQPEDIPAKEISDNLRLCKRPLVSVLIITYNQEQFIGQAIDSALAQKTDFEYEILVGDDCSTDKTGAICAEYQRRYPEQVRFITAAENVHSIDGNWIRLKYHARGEFIAILEGDDYWTDEEKLQKQVEVFREHSDVTLCLSGRETLNRDGTVEYAHNAHFDSLFAKSPEPAGTLFDFSDYFAHPLGGPVGVSMYRKNDIDYEELCTFYYRTSFTVYYLLLKKGKGYLLKKPMTMYRVNPNGVWSGKSPMEQARFSYEYFGQLLLHDPKNMAIKSMQKTWWRRFMRYIFPWSILFALKRRFDIAVAFFVGCCVTIAVCWMCAFPSVRDKVDEAHEILQSKFLSPDGLLYAYVGDIPDAEDCARGFPNALGYWTPIENTPMFTGSYLSAMVSRAERIGDYESAILCRNLAQGLIKIAEVSEVPGMIVRGFGKDGICHYSSSTTCQYIPWFLGLHTYMTSRISSPAERIRIRNVMVNIANELLAIEWKCPCDGPLSGCFHGRINAKDLPHRDSAHYLFVLAAMYDVTGDAAWLHRYEEAKNEFCEKAQCSRIEACSLGWGLDKAVYDPESAGNMWIYVCTQECIAELYRLDSDSRARSLYLKGLCNNAERAAPHMALARKYDNDRGQFLYANWRDGYLWNVQTNIDQAMAVAYTGNQKVLGKRKWYERKYVSEPLAAAAICAYAGYNKSDVMDALRRYDYSEINISEFFFAEIAYWKFSERR